MTEIRDIFARVAQDQPPLTITAASAIAAGRRTRRRTTGLQTVAAAVAVAAVVIGAAAMAGGGPGAARPVDVGSAPTPTPNAGPSPRPDPPERVAARLTAALRAAAAEVRPDAEFVADPLLREGVRPGPLEVLPPRPPDIDWYEGFATVVDRKGKGTLYLGVAAAGTSMSIDTEPCAAFTARRTSCEPRTGPHGEPMSVTRTGKAGGARDFEVKVFLPDRSVVLVRASNYTSASGTQYRAGPSFTVAQLIRLATSPGLALDPPEYRYIDRDWIPQPGDERRE
jgi:hypothetical protein